MKRVLATIGVLITLSMAISPQASAACKLYEKNDYLGTVLFNKSASGWWNLTGGNNNEASSLNNATSLDGGFWYDANLTGKCIGMRRQTAVAWFATWDDNQASSVKLGSYC